METKLKIGTDFRTGTIAYYGPDDKTVTKIVVGITVGAGYNFIDTKKWSSESKDIKNDNQILKEISDYLYLSKVDSVARIERVMGCPHEAGINYRRHAMSSMSILGKRGVVRWYESKKIQKVSRRKRRRIFER